MTTKEYLNRGWMIERRIRAAEDRLGRLSMRAAALKSHAPKKKRGGRRAREKEMISGKKVKAYA